MHWKGQRYNMMMSTDKLHKESDSSEEVRNVHLVEIHRWGKTSEQVMSKECTNGGNSHFGTLSPMPLYLPTLLLQLPDHPGSLSIHHKCLQKKVHVKLDHVPTFGHISVARREGWRQQAKQIPLDSWTWCLCIDLRVTFWIACCLPANGEQSGHTHMKQGAASYVLTRRSQSL